MEVRTKHFGQKYFIHRLFGEKNYTAFKFFKIRLKNFLGGEYEATKFLRNVINPGDVFFDIGANLGQYALRLNKPGYEGLKVYLFEPVSANYRKLYEYFGNTERMRVENAAVSDYSGEAELLIPVISGIKIDTQASIDRDSRQRDYDDYLMEKVNVITIDEYVAANNITKVDFIKSDTEGEDGKVVLGAKRTIASFNPVIITEDILQGEPIEFLHNEGYADYFASTDGCLVKADTEGVKSGMTVPDVIIYLHSKSAESYKEFIKQK